MNKYFFLRHAKTINDPAKHAVEWSLEKGALSILDSYIKDGLFDDVKVIATSTEPKAIATAQPISKYLNIKTISQRAFNEVERSGVFLTDEEFLEQKRKQFQNINFTPVGGESTSDAIIRFNSGIEVLEKKYTNSDILIVSHGTILTLYFSEILNNFEKAFERWSVLNFCALGIVKEGKVLKDIV